MGFISWSFLLGVPAARQFMGVLIAHGLSWRAVFQVAAGTLLIIFIANLLLLKESRAQIGLGEPDVNPLNLFGAKADEPKPSRLRDFLGPLFRSPVRFLHNESLAGQIPPAQLQLRSCCPCQCPSHAYRPP